MKRQTILDKEIFTTEMEIENKTEYISSLKYDIKILKKDLRILNKELNKKRTLEAKEDKIRDTANEVKAEMEEQE